MNIEGTNKDIGNRYDTGGLSGIGRWNRTYPRLSRVLWIALGLLIVAGVVWLVYPAPQTPRGFGGPGGNIQSVGVVQAKIAPINVTLNGLGTVTPLATATIHPQVSGMLTKLFFTEGQLVKAGDVLAQVDPRTYQAALDQVKGSLARDQANLANDQVDLARYKALAAQNAISNQMLSTQQAKVNADQGLVASDKANVENAQINLGYTRIVSPVDGRVGLHQTDIGNIVSGTSTIVVVTALSPISVLFTVPEDQVSTVMGRLNSGANLSVDASDRTQTTIIAPGKLANVDNQVDITTGTVKMRALFDNADGKLFPNQFVNVKLLVDTLRDQVVIPVPAVQRGSDGAYVFVVSPDKTVSQRAVTLGIQDGQNVAITKGLTPGDTVVVDGADRLRDGATVNIPAGGRIVAPSPAPAGGAAGGAGARGGDPAQRAARLAAITKACTADLAKFCAGQDPRTANRCLFQNASSLSSDCSKAVTAGRGNRGGGRGFGGGFGGGP